MADDTWEKLWDARVKGMEQTFGPHAPEVLHALVPFHIGQDIGGSPDVVIFPSFTNGALYVTAELICSEQPPNSMGNYELAVAHQGDEQWGVNIICQLAYYTLHTVLEDGQTMDIGSATPDGSTIEAFLFRRIAEFDVLGKTSNVICCVGITGPELEYSQTNGSAALIQRLGTNFVTTDLYRDSKI